jgi:hypothetical protein
MSPPSTYRPTHQTEQTFPTHQTHPNFPTHLFPFFPFPLKYSPKLKNRSLQHFKFLGQFPAIFRDRSEAP